MVGLALGTLLAAALSLALLRVAPDVPLIWFPAGVALAALVRWGPSLWPAVALAALGVSLASGMPALPALATAAGQTLGPLTAAWALRALGLHPQLDRPRDLWLFAAIGMGVGGLICACFAMALLALPGSRDFLGIASAGVSAWYGQAMGMVALGVPLLTLSRPARMQMSARPRGMMVALVGAAALAAGFFGLSAGRTHPALASLLFVPFLLLAWMTVRSGVFASGTVALLLAVGGVLIGAASTDGATAASMPPLWAYAASLCAMPPIVGVLVGELKVLTERQRLALECWDAGVAEWDVRADVFTLSPSWLSVLGLSTQSFGTSFAAVCERVHEDDRATLRETLESLRGKSRERSRAEFRMQCIDGRWAWLESYAVVAARTRRGTPTRVVITARDASAQRAAEERYQLSANLFQHLHEGLLITDANHRVLDANPTFTAITGYSRDEMLGTVPAVMRPAAAGSPAERQQAAMRESLQNSGTWHGEVVDVRRNGEPCTLHVTISAVKGPHGQARFHALAMVDVTQAQAQRTQLERQAHTDELTGLPNRARLAHMLAEAMRASEREGFLLTICYLDLDHFKPVNDSHGHEAGDRLLAELADRLRRSLRHWASGDDAVARLGGDEFVLLLRTATLEEGRHAVQRVMRSVSQPYGLGVGAGPVLVTASIGATVYPIDRADADTLLRHADHAMYGAKQAGRNGYLFFDAEHDRRTEQHFEALGRVQDALDGEQFALYYQPKVDMRQGRVLGVEALLRWKHPQHGVIAPAQFLPLIEHTGLSARLGDWVLQQGIEQLAKWQRMGLDMTVSINISARHLQEPMFAKRLAGLLARHTTPVGHRLIIEILETAALADVDYTCALMQECRELGVRFALDDFGTGYSTFTYLKRLPLDFLKIDRSFVHNMLNDRQDLAIVEGVIGLSETFGCKVVAEGVELPEQAVRLIELGCDIGQGNGIAAAMPVDEVHPWVRAFSMPVPPPQWAETV